MKTAILNSLSYFAVYGNVLILVVKKMFWRPITKSCYDLSDSCHENITPLHLQIRADQNASLHAACSQNDIRALILISGNF